MVDKQILINYFFYPHICIDHVTQFLITLT